MEKSLIGTISKIIFKSPDNYVVGLFRVKDSVDDEFDKRNIYITGYFYDIVEGENLKIFGQIVIHPKYGEQFSVSHYEKMIPDEKDSLMDFLTSVKGVGEKTAEKIIKILGDNAIKLILEDSTNLDRVKLSKKVKDNILMTLNEYSASYNIILRLNKLGFSTKESTLIYKNYKLEAESIIDENLYTFLDLDSLSFKKVDLIALKNGYEIDDKRRVERGILQVLLEYTNALGHSYLNYEELYHYTNLLLRVNIDEDIFSEVLNRLIVEFLIIKNEDKYYLRDMYQAEENIVDRVIHLINLKQDKIKNEDNEKLIDELENKNKIKYNIEQKNAILKSINSNFLIITGGPGTGKTTIVRSIISMYEKVNNLSYDDMLGEVILLAPTGRASKRLSEKSKYPASTIHSFLKWNKENNRFSVNEYNRSDARLLIIDEASMLDYLLFDNLLKGVRNDCRIIMVGDYNQLPSVGPGQLLKDLIESDLVDIEYLKRLYRQEEDSSIVEFAHNINNGILDTSLFNNNDDLIFVNSKDTVKDIIDICKDLKLKLHDDFQVLAPMYKGINGIDRLNYELQELFNPKKIGKKEIKIGDNIFREDDKVLQLINIPDEKIFNGDIGFIKEINNKNITIDFDGVKIDYTPANYSNFTLGYAISIHKAQGSEFDIVIVPVVDSYYRMLYRKLYYTAITRSKKKLFIVGSEYSLLKALENNEQDIRKTNIRKRLIESVEK